MSVGSRAPGGAPPFWSVPVEELLARVGSAPGGLSSAAAAARAAALADGRRATGGPGALALLLRQFESPIVLLLLGAAVLSAALRDAGDAAIILAIVLLSAGLGFWQEHGAARAMRVLLAAVRTRATVLRDGVPQEVPVDAVVPGDVVRLSAGDAVPADCRLLGARDLFVEEAALTGETFPVEKAPGVAAADAPLAQRPPALFLGSHVVSGTATALAIAVGRATEFGAIAERLRLRAPETEFERGVRQFGYLLSEVTFVLLAAIFAANVWLNRPVLDSLLFSLALAVGLTPQLLPAIISVNLAHGARRMAAANVIVKRLATIENLGSMDTLCADKTGTLTEGRVRVHGALDVEGRDSERVFRLAWLNATHESGFRNPLDVAIRAHRALDAAGTEKLDELPYDFLRKRLSVLVADGGRHVIAMKGAVPQVLDACTTAERGDGTTVPLAAVRDAIEARWRALGADGFRTLGIAVRDVGTTTRIAHDDERDMTFVGLLALWDPPKAGVADTLAALARLGVRLRIVTGDNGLVARTVATRVGMAAPRVVTGPELRRVSDQALRARADEVDVFAEIEPNQKERIVRALQAHGHVVGYLGDGINDAPALHAADVGLSVDGAVDVAKEAADLVLLAHDLDVIVDGIREGRATFANTLKYVFMATSANFGNMFSMAGASLFLPFLPLLPKQVLLTNLLTDLPEMAISTDRVDPDWIARPRRWDVRFIRNFMLVFGPLSSVFDYCTFGVLLFLLRAGPDEFRAGWFVESVVSASLVVLVIRTRGACFRSRPGAPLVVATLAVVALAVAIPATALAPLLGFVPLPASFAPALAGIVALYVASAELAKRAFYRGEPGPRGLF